MVKKVRLFALLILLFSVDITESSSPEVTHQISGYVNVSNTAASSETPIMVVDSAQTTHVIWMEGAVGSRELFYAQRPFGGNWSGRENITNDASDVTIFDFDVSSTGKVQVVWRTVTGAPNQNFAYYAERNPGGGWTSGQQLPGSLQAAREPSIVLDSDDNAHIVWNGGGPGKIYHIRRSSVGTWSSITTAHGGSFGPAYNEPRLAIDDNGILHVLWFVSGNVSNSRVWYIQGNPDTNTWSPLTQLMVPNSTGFYIEHEFFVESDGAVHAIWVGGNELRYATQDLNGNWSDYDLLSQSASDAQLTVTEDRRVHVVWAEEGDVHYSVKDTDGSWSEAVNISNMSAGAMEPKVVASENGRVQVVWSALDTASFDIFEAHQTFTGSWSNPENVSENGGDSTAPFLVTASPGSYQLVWSDDTPGNNEILYTEWSLEKVHQTFIPLVLKL